ncbi:TRAP transporter substrate-binding protein DctP [Lentibacter sp. XHP0401]|uniref:TRAP transporter substrate-binding protein DctP n=1 Tax=Lentibacter sp. XHP0401 TaxID=2984334 RepID=UPI0021E8DAD2|nr:TRAP transporter substrate-binding protein DctP [Lentibacter sp. XHP0401]MCV2892721.1 TRAP transporter substrate-binding protein DctP [Lentibacter sp. XHP0401]
MTFNAMKYALATAVAVSGLSSAAQADEVALRSVSAFQLGTVFYEPFERFVERVNENGKGIVQIEVIGGPEAMPPFEVGNALRGGIIDLANTTAVFHANLVPEGLAMTLTNLSMEELRENGGYDLLDQLHRDKAKIHWLGRLTQNIQYYIYLSELPDDVDFDALKIRSAPTYQAFFTGLGITPVQTAPGEVFTALERGTIDGYAWPSLGVFDLGWQEKTAARIEPGFNQVETGVYFSEASWEKLTQEQQDFLTEQMVAFESEANRYNEFANAEFARQAEYGIATVELEGEQLDNFVKMSNEEGWKPVMAASPEAGQKLRDLLVK